MVISLMRFSFRTGCIFIEAGQQSSHFTLGLTLLCTTLMKPALTSLVDSKFIVIQKTACFYPIKIIQLASNFWTISEMHNFLEFLKICFLF